MKAIDIYDDEDFNDLSRQSLLNLVEKRKKPTHSSFKVPSVAYKDKAKLFQFIHKV
jgi:hypothetical protein